MRPRASSSADVDLIAGWRQAREGRSSARPATAGSGMSTWAWSAAAAGSAVALGVTFAAQLGAPWQTVAALAFLAIAPGASLVPLVGLPDRGMELMLVIPVSFAVDALTSAALFYPGLWSAGRELVLLLSICLLGIAAQQVVARRWTSVGEPR